MSIKKNAIIILTIIHSFLSFSQVQQYFFVDDVDVVEYLWVNICIGDNGKTISVEGIADKTTYKNTEVIKQIIDYRLSIDFEENSKYSNHCFEYPFSIVNSKYQSLNLAVENCENLFFRGTYRYLNPKLPLVYNWWLQQ